MKWSEAFIDFLYRIIRARMVLFAYVVRESLNITYSLLALALDSSPSEEYSSMEEEIIEFTSHIYLIF